MGVDLPEGRLMARTKKCTQCGEHKPVERFSPSTTSRDGIHWECLDCARVRSAAYRRRKPGKAAESRAAWRAKPGNRDRDKAMQRAKDRARRRLAERHADEYADLLDEERHALGLPPAQRRRLVG